MLRRMLPTLAVLALGLIALLWGLGSLQGIILDERQEAHARVWAERNALQEYARRTLEQRLESLEAPTQLRLLTVEGRPPGDDLLARLPEIVGGLPQVRDLIDHEARGLGREHVVDELGQRAHPLVRSVVGAVAAQDAVHLLPTVREAALQLGHGIRGARLLGEQRVPLGPHAVDHQAEAAGREHTSGHAYHGQQPYEARGSALNVPTGSGRKLA